MNAKIEQSMTKAEQVAQTIAAEIKQGILKPGQRMGGMRELASRFNVSFAVINSAYNQLAGEGFLIRKNRSGTYVNDSPTMAPAKSLALITDYHRSSIDNYFEPLLNLTGEHRVIPMFGCVAEHHDAPFVLQDILSHKPDKVFLDLEARKYNYEQLIESLAGVPYCFVNRWQWHTHAPANAILVDYESGYVDAIAHLKERGHEKIAFICHHKTPQPYLRSFLENACEKNGMEFDINNYLGITDDRLISTEVKDFFSAQKPTALLSIADYIFERLALLLGENQFILKDVEKVGFFNQRHSQIPGAEFSTIDPCFVLLWQEALNSIGDTSPMVKYITPKLIKRGSKNEF